VINSVYAIDPKTGVSLAIKQAPVKKK